MTDSTRDKAYGAILAALPALIVALTALMNAEATRRSEAATYQNAAITAGEQGNEIEELRARLAKLEEVCRAR